MDLCVRGYAGRIAQLGRFRLQPVQPRRQHGRFGTQSVVGKLVQPDPMHEERPGRMAEASTLNTLLLGAAWHWVGPGGAHRSRLDGRPVKRWREKSLPQPRPGAGLCVVGELATISQKSFCLGPSLWRHLDWKGPPKVRVADRNRFVTGTQGLAKGLPVLGGAPVNCPIVGEPVESQHGSTGKLPALAGSR